MCVSEAGRDEGTPIMAVRKEGAVAQHIDHQGLEAIGDLIETETRLVWCEREAMPGHRGDDNRERVGWRAAEPRWMRQARDELVILVERPGPAVRQQQRLCRCALSLLVDEVEIDATDRHLELTKGIQLRFVPPPVVAVAPVGAEMLQVGGIGAVVPRCARNPVWPTRARQPIAKIIKGVELASTFADQAAIAIENVRLFESVEARTRELAKSLEDLRSTQDRLVQTKKLASLGQLTAGIAHEIKNPLNFVNNFSTVSSELVDELQDTLKGLAVDDKTRKQFDDLTTMLRGNLDKVVQHGKRADAIVKNMLLHSREGSGEHRPVDINTLVEEGLNLAYHGARAEKQGFNITLERSLDPTTGEADVFPQDITRALLNLILNGFYAATKRKAEANGGDYEPTLTAATKNLGDRVEIRIRDNGTGIPADVKEKIFNPFFTTKPAGEGTGLGLSISHDIIVKQHGGSIEVDTEPGQFTEIRVILPRAAVVL